MNRVIDMHQSSETAFSWLWPGRWQRRAWLPRALRRLPAAFIAAVCLLIVGSLLPPAAPAQALETNRWGPPWVGVVKVDGAVTYPEPSLDSAPIGPLGKGAKIPVLQKTQGSPGPDGDTTWYVTPVGKIPSAYVDEYRQPWVAEVTQKAISVYAYPNAKSVVRRVARQGDLLRVTGVTAGLDGDPNYWYATTEGFVGLNTVRESISPAAQVWTLPDPKLAANGWWGEVNTDSANVRTSASTSAPIVGQLYAGARVKVLAEQKGENVGGSSTWYTIDGGRYAGGLVHSSLIRRIAPPRANTTPLPAIASGNLYINVDRKNASLTVVQNGQPIFVTYVSLGKAGRDTPSGLYSTFGKFLYDDMRSANVANPTHSYDLPNVPYTQYYKDGGYALHGTYWHDAFGSQQSQGCINVTVTDAAYLFSLTSPALTPDQPNEVWAAPGEATPVQILD